MRLLATSLYQRLRHFKSITCRCFSSKLLHRIQDKDLTEKVALVEHGSQLTYGQLNEASFQLAVAFADGLKAKKNAIGGFTKSGSSFLGTNY